MNYRDLLSLAKDGGKYHKSYPERVWERLTKVKHEKDCVAYHSDAMKKALQDEILEKYYL